MYQVYETKWSWSIEMFLKSWRMFKMTENILKRWLHPVLSCNFMWTFELIKNLHFGKVNFWEWATSSFFANEALDLKHDNYLISCCFLFFVKKVPRNRETTVSKRKLICGLCSCMAIAMSIRSESKRNNKHFNNAGNLLLERYFEVCQVTKLHLLVLTAGKLFEKTREHLS